MRAARAHGASTAASSGDTGSGVRSTFRSSDRSPPGSGAGAGSASSAAATGACGASTGSGSRSDASDGARPRCRRPPDEPPRASGRDRPRCGAAQDRGGRDAASTRALPAARAGARGPRAARPVWSSALPATSACAPGAGERRTGLERGGAGRAARACEPSIRPLRTRTRCTACCPSSTRERKGVDNDLSEAGGRLRRGDRATGTATAARSTSTPMWCAGPGVARRRRRHPERATGRAGRRRERPRRRPAARHHRRPQRPARALPRQACWSTSTGAPRGHRDPGRSGPGLVPAGDRRPGGDRRRRPARAARSPAVLGLDAAALRPALGRRRGASATSATCAPSPTGPAPSTARGAVLLNPLHAITPVPPVQPSPYTPSSRRFGTPLALRLTDLARLRPGRPGHPGRGRRAAPGDRRRPDRARPGLGGQALGRRAAVAFRRAARSPATPARRPVGVRHVLRAGRALRRAVEPLAGGAAAPASPAVARAAAPSWPRGSPSTPGCSSRCSSSSARSGPRPAAVGVARGARPGRGLRPGGRRRLGAAGRAGPRRPGRRPAGRVQPAGPGLGAAAVAARTGWPPPATPPTATCCARCCARPTGCASTTSPGCGGCGGCRPARPRPAARTCTTTPR